MSLQTFPSAQDLEEAAAKTPDFMKPSTTPYAAWYEGFLPDLECEEIIKVLSVADTYQHNGCGALTREFVAAPVLDTIEKTARMINTLYWGYDLDPGQHSWFQSYEKGSRYQPHMDGAPGQTRKLTAVALLSDPADYTGGELRLTEPTKAQWIPRTRGTIVVFPPWLVHEVKPVTSGFRQTINMGFWGPPFR